MKILVLLKMVPDVVEELEVAPDGASLDRGFLRLIVNERDENALEQALILKERHQGTVVVVAPEAPEVDDVLFTALARGADRVIKVMGVGEGAGSREVGAALAAALPSIPDLLPVDLVLTGCQAIDDLDGVIGPLLARALGLPYIGIVTGLDLAGPGTAACLREYPGGVRGRFELDLPAVVGIQGAEKPPRYVPIAKVRLAMSSGRIEEVSGPGGAPAGLDVVEMKKPEVAERAEMITGSVDEIAARICEILAERGLV
jgi:electron transfer flavoprotein beta subunit